MSESPWRDEDTLRRLYQAEQLSTLQISDRLGCHKTTVLDWMKRLGIERRGPDEYHQAPSILREKKHLEREYIKKRKSIPDIAGEYGCSHTAVWKWLRHHGIDRRGPGEAIEAENHPNWNGGREGYYGPNWYRQRRRARRRDEYKCQRCGTGESEHKEEHDEELHVHHITPIKEFKEGDSINYGLANELKNLITLCRGCHQDLEGVPVDLGV